MLTAELQFLPLFLVYFILNIMICFTSRPNDTSSRTNCVCQRALKRSWYIAFTWSWSRFYFFSIHVSCPLLVLYLGEAEELAGPLINFHCHLWESHGSPSPTRGSTKKDVQKLRKSTFLPALAFSQLISMYQKMGHNVLFWNSNYINCHLGPHYLPVFKWSKRHITT